jgi:protein SCO1/2
MKPVNRRFALAALLAGGTLLGCGPDKPAFQAIDITGAQYARRLELPDASGKSRTLADFSGHVVAVFFGYTQCPDVCPTTMAEINEVRQKLGPDGDKLQAVFVTVDPERDTPEVLTAYVANFGRDVVGLRGTLDQTKAAAQEFKVFFAKVPGSSAGSYSIDHTAGLYIFDPKGRIRLFLRQGNGSASALEHDVRLLLAGA